MLSSILGLIIFIALLGVVALIFWIWMLVDCIRNPELDTTTKLLWALLIFFTGIIGAFLYLFLGKTRTFEKVIHVKSKKKRLYRSRKNRVIAGVCGGLAEYLDVDPTLVRLAWVAFTLLGGSGILIYIVFWIVVPKEP